MIGKKITALELKKINKNRIFRYLYDNKELSRQDLVQGLSLSLPTVTQNLNELEESGLIDYVGNFNSTGGRKAQVITLRKEARITIGIEIRKTYIRILIIDLYGRVLDYEKYIKTFSTEEEYSRNLAYLVKNMVEQNQIEKEKILGIGLAVPAVFDSAMEYIIKAPSLELYNYPVKKLTQYFEYPVVIENDANSGAFNELWNHYQGESMIYLLIEKGIGGCMIQKDNIVKGCHHHAGEFGHMTLYPKGRDCKCGQKGCLEAYISIARISEDLDCQVEDFFAGLSAGNKEYHMIWEEYMENLCIGIHNIYMMYDEQIVLGGILTGYLEPYAEKIIARLSEMNIFEGSGDYLKLAKYQSRAVAVGAALQLVSGFMKTV